MIGTAAAATFVQLAPITINDNVPATPYPSTNVVSGMVGNVTKVTVTWSNISHTYPADLDILLVGPGGQNVMLLSSAGGGGDLTNAVLTFDGTGAQAISPGNQLTNGVYRPADYGSAPLTAPAPEPPGGIRPYNTNLSVFNGVDPNGTWQLFVNDHAGGDVGSIGSWLLEVVTDAGQFISARAYTFTTLAGKGSSVSADGVGDAARFGMPSGIALDGAGNLYVTDQQYRNSKLIRKVTTAGVVSTLSILAGTSSSAGGTNSNVWFSGAGDITTDSVGNLFVQDDSTIRKVTPSGTNWVVSTIAGLAGNPGSADGTNTNARFSGPGSITVDSVGALFLADDNTIRKITPVGTNWVVSTIAGLAGNPGSADGTNANARFSRPGSIAVDSAGTIFLADDGTIRKITPVGTNWVVNTLAGSAAYSGNADGTGSDARFTGIGGIAVEGSGNIFVTDSGNSTIRIVTAAGVVSTLAGSPADYGYADGTGSNARFRNPQGIAADNANNLYIADSGNYSIRKITTAGIVTTVAGLAGNSGSMDGVGSNARFSYLRGIAAGSVGNLYVADTFNHTIRKVTTAGVVSTIAGLAGSPGSTDGTGSNARFNLPEGITVDISGNIFVADSGNNTIRKLALVGTNWLVSTLAGLAGNGGSTDGTGSDSQFNYPCGIAVDSVDNLYVADLLNYTIRKITPVGTNWVASTIIGLAGSYGSADGTGGNARSSGMKGIALDSTGNIYVTDPGISTETTGNHTIRKITPVGTNWTITTIAGLVDDPDSVDGIGSNARFDYPCGIAVDSAGNLYVADRSNSKIRKGVFMPYSPIISTPYSPLPMNCQLSVTLLPPEANGQWRFPWEFGWHNSGNTVSNLVAGNYPIEFRSKSGWLAVPFSGPVTLSTGESVSVTNQYYPTLSSVSTNSGGGSLTVNLGVNPPVGAGWRFLGDTTPFLGSGYMTNLPAGTYLIEFAPVGGRAKPSSQTVQVQSGLPAYVSVSYLLATTPSGNFYLPFLVQSNQVSEEINYPFGFNGQLQSDVGFGSGVAVANNVVLTAAHLVFNDQSLSYVSRAHWFFRRDAGVSEPMPQAARGYYLLSGYAAQRTNDLQSGYSPDQSTPPSRNVDVAALYFLQSVAGGGHGGYLPSDAVPNTWLTSTELKMLVGYPVDGSQFGVNVEPGKMYQTDPQPYPLSLATDPVPGQQQVYTAPWFLSYPGNSGGPMYVQLNGQYYPAAVYLGTLFSGSTPYASIVRAIDSAVVSLITNAATMGDSGTNNTGGGVITIIPSQSISANNPGYLQLHLGPSSAVQAGAGWRLQGDPAYSTATNYMRLVSATNALAVEFKPVAGWNLPVSQSVTVLPGQLTSYNAIYTVVPPVMLADASGIRITGTPSTTYRIERMDVGAGVIQWTAISTNTLAAGTNIIVSLPQANPSAALYRAVWLPSL